MVEEELLDLVNREGKMPGGFCTSFPSYKRPYVFSNFNATDQDVLVLTHEIGHAYQSYASRNQPLIGYLWPTAEAAEIHSMSMELMTWPWMDQFFGEGAQRFKYKPCGHSFLSALRGLRDHFQHWVFEHPQATPRSARSNGSNSSPSIFPIEITMTLHSLTPEVFGKPNSIFISALFVTSITAGTDLRPSNTG